MSNTLVLLSEISSPDILDPFGNFAANFFCTQRDQVKGFRRYTAMSKSTITCVQIGRKYTKSFRIFFKDMERGIISPFHDIPLRTNPNDPNSNEFNMVVEIPRWTNAKMEISKQDPLNPIRQDIKKGELRYVSNLFPYHGYIWNYGALPQTYEDPNYKYEGTDAFGDDDPLDVIEIGNKIHDIGSIVRVKVLGVLGLLDEGETDWKILAIDVNDKRAPDLNDISDLEVVMPGFIAHSTRWFRLYKVPTGKKPNHIAFNGQFKDKKFALEIVEHTNQAWKQLMKEGKNLCKNDKRSKICLQSCENNLTAEERDKIIESERCHLESSGCSVEVAGDRSGSKASDSGNLHFVSD
ncbi:hypothetical protein GJ496_007786 [Pomphorhynchus laevis]|nr:hypothetical protein GJ496_007786 [Pomphorhynchus laevis]